MLRIHESPVCSIRFLPIDCSVDLPVFMQECDHVTNCQGVFRVFLRRARSEVLLDQDQERGVFCFAPTRPTHARTHTQTPPNIPSPALYFSVAQQLLEQVKEATPPAPTDPWSRGPGLTCGRLPQSSGICPGLSVTVERVGAEWHPSLTLV